MAVPAFNGVPFWLSSHLSMNRLNYYITPPGFVKGENFSLSFGFVSSGVLVSLLDRLIRIVYKNIRI